MTRAASVIVPTHGRPEKLRKCLDALRRQELPADQSLEIVVAEDGAADAEDATSTRDGDVLRLRLPRVGIAGARNAAIAAATGEILLFTNDDCYPAEDWARQHLSAHARHGDDAMVVGRTDWMAWPNPTVFDGLLRDTSIIFFYNRMRDGETYGFRHFWTCNASVSSRSARAVGGFDERLRPYGFEDIEFAYRVERAGAAGVRYVEAARNVHDHRVRWGDYLNRESCLGRMAACLADVNRACFRALYGDEAPGQLRDEFEAWLALDAGDHVRVEARMAAWCAEPLTKDEGWLTLRDAIEAAHRPIKRRYFRQGYVDGFGLRSERQWETRLALGHSFP